MTSPTLFFLVQLIILNITLVIPPSLMHESELFVFLCGTLEIKPIRYIIAQIYT